ncbi:hypothetical protein C8Q74DRAFT_1311068 [Fomes fomentarius]|nr:hypothetical protein C8Q74DRAFT_1311068 [Fomes fomentarius]
MGQDMLDAEVERSSARRPFRSYLCPQIAILGSFGQSRWGIIDLYVRRDREKEVDTIGMIFGATKIHYLPYIEQSTIKLLLLERKMLNHVCHRLQGKD